MPYFEEDLYTTPENPKSPVIEVIDNLVKMLDQERKESRALQAELDDTRLVGKAAREDLERARAERGVADNARFKAEALLAKFLKEFAPVVASSTGLDEVDPKGGTAEKIPTIKFVRERWNIGLKEAKDLVDGWQMDGKIVFRGY